MSPEKSNSPSEQFLGRLFGLDGKIAVVIGAGGHLCSEFSRGLAGAGCHVALVDVREEKATSVRDELREAGYSRVSAHAADATKKADLQQVLDDIIAEHGVVDILINGAGINDPTPVLDLSVEAWDAVMASQVTATFLGSQVFGEAMLAQQRGSIINISSASAGPPLSKAFAYSVAKAGIRNLTQNLAREWATAGVRVNALRPGFFPTDWNRKNFITPDRERAILGHTPMARYGLPEELVGAVVWLASDAASFVTGAEVTVDGGFSCMTI